MGGRRGDYAGWSSNAYGVSCDICLSRLDNNFVSGKMGGRRGDCPATVGYPSLNAVRAANGGELPVWAGTYIDAL